MPKRVLVVDDHAPTRLLIRSILEAEKDAPCVVVEAASGFECVRARDAQGPFDLILLDVNLPDIDGYDLCRRLRSVDPDVRIVFVTGKSDLRDHEAGRQAGGDSYLVKPVARAALRSAVSLFTSMRRRGGADPVPASA